MFTGIVEEMGTVAELTPGGPGASLRIRCEVVHTDASVGDSISVSGCCLTVTELRDDGFVTEMMGETLERTALGDLEVGAAVNLERALRADARLGGHFVQGHVDGVGHVTDIVDRGEWHEMTFSMPGAVGPYVVEKGSICIDGVSLTVMSATATAFAVGLIPHTLAVTTLGQRAAGDRVNLEADVIAKYLERLLAARTDPEAGGTNDR